MDVLDDLPTELRVNKGNVGQLIETYLGLRTANQRTDFTDGELKSTNVKRCRTSAKVGQFSGLKAE